MNFKLWKSRKSDQSILKITNEMFVKDFKHITHERGISFHQTMRPVILLARIFSLMPMKGSNGNHSSSIKFVLKSTQTVYAFLTITGSGVVLGITVFWLFDSSIDLDKIGVFMFYAANFSGAILFVIIAKSWASLIIHFEKIENRLVGNSVSQRIISGNNIKLITILVLSFGLSKYIVLYFNEKLIV